MRKRSKPNEKTAVGRPETGSREVPTKRQGNKSTWSAPKLILTGIGIGILCLCLIVVLRSIPEAKYHPVLSYIAPYVVYLSRPVHFSLNHTINLYLSSEKGITLGVWHTVPQSLCQEAQGKDHQWYQQTLNNGAPVFIYLHGNGGNRGSPKHRVGVVNLLSTAGFHVVSMDYRGYGDSSGVPTEAGMTTDAVYVYQWVKARSGNSPVIMWGHSIGTGVSTNTAVKLQEQGNPLDGVILEGSFSRLPPNMGRTNHPFIWYYWRFPYVQYFLSDAMLENKVVFPSADNVRKLRAPLLILHAEDDHLTPLQMAQELYDIARKARNSDKDVKLVPFEAAHGYLHNGLYRDPRLPTIIKEFVSSLRS